MSYWLGIDLGTTFTAAAVWRGGQAQVVDLGTRAAVVPSVVLLRYDGELVVGEAAERRAASEPERVAREFKRRIGDPTPIMLAGTPVSADALTARLLRWTADKVAEAEGGPPERVAVSHPANWRDFKQDLLHQVIRQADLDDARTLSEPEAAAIHYASQQRVPTGSVVAVYDLGGGTFDATVLRQDDGGWSILGEPEGIERLGGIDFDEAVFQHVVASLGDVVTDLDPDDPAATAAVARLRRECVAAKEALAADTDASVPVVLPSLQTEVRITRGEFEDLIEPSLTQSITALRRALRGAGVAADDVHAVLLVGGSSRIPLVAELVSAELGRPIALDAHPKYGVALGLAMTAAGADRPMVATTGATDTAGAGARPVAGVAAAGVAAGAGVAAAEDAAAAGPPGDSSDRPVEPSGAHPAATGVRAGATSDEDLTEPGWAVAADDPTEPVWAIAADGGEPPPGEPHAARPQWGDDEDARVAPRRHRLLVGALAAAALLVAGSGVAMALRGGSDDGDSPRATTTTITAEASTTAPPTTDPPASAVSTTADPGRSQAPATTPTADEAPTTTAPTTTTTSTTSTTSTTTTTTPDDDPVAPVDESAQAGDEDAAAPDG